MCHIISADNRCADETSFDDNCVVDMYGLTEGPRCASLGRAQSPVHTRLTGQARSYVGTGPCLTRDRIVD